MQMGLYMFCSYKNRVSRFFQFEPVCRSHVGSIFGAVFLSTRATPAVAYLANQNLPKTYSTGRTCGAPV